MDIDPQLFETIISNIRDQDLVDTTTTYLADRTRLTNTVRARRATAQTHYGNAANPPVVEGDAAQIAAANAAYSREQIRLATVALEEATTAEREIITLTADWVTAFKAAFTGPVSLKSEENLRQIMQAAGQRSVEEYKLQEAARVRAGEEAAIEEHTSALSILHKTFTTPRAVVKKQNEFRAWNKKSTVVCVADEGVRECTREDVCPGWENVTFIGFGDSKEDVNTAFNCRPCLGDEAWVSFDYHHGGKKGIGICSANPVDILRNKADLILWVLFLWLALCFIYGCVRGKRARARPRVHDDRVHREYICSGDEYESE